MCLYLPKRGKFMYHSKGLHDFFRILSCSESWFFKLSVSKKCENTLLNHYWPDPGALLALASHTAFISSATQTSILRTGVNGGDFLSPTGSVTSGQPVPSESKGQAVEGRRPLLPFVFNVGKTPSVFDCKFIKFYLYP